MFFSNFAIINCFVINKNECLNLKTDIGSNAIYSFFFPTEVICEVKILTKVNVYDNSFFHFDVIRFLLIYKDYFMIFLIG